MLQKPNDLHPTTWQILQALRSGIHLSRNRHFQLFRDPNARRGLKLYRYLQSVIRDVRQYAHELSVHEVVDGNQAGAYALRLTFPMIHGHRIAYLRETELTLLAQDAPEIAEMLLEAPLSAACSQPS
ncbi:MAG: hypothetical protein VYA30_04905 [Myxococcota bacterium]|nr:hypothetical protein [Myxococcota bacterium]